MSAILRRNNSTVHTGPRIAFTLHGLGYPPAPVSFRYATAAWVLGSTRPGAVSDGLRAAAPHNPIRRQRSLLRLLRMRCRCGTAPIRIGCARVQPLARALNGSSRAWAQAQAAKLREMAQSAAQAICTTQPCLGWADSLARQLRAHSVLFGRTMLCRVWCMLHAAHAKLA